MSGVNVVPETLRMVVFLRYRVGFDSGCAATTTGPVSKVVRLEEATEPLEEEVGVG